MKVNQITHARLFSEWHPTLNDGKKLEDFQTGSNFRAWWVCPVAEDHIWDTEISHRAARGDNCPFCGGYRVCLSNSLARDPNSVLLKEFDYNKNEQQPAKLYFKSLTKVWWKCLKAGHSWETSVTVRQRGQNCPYCSNQKTNFENSIANLYPEAAALLNEEKTSKTADQLNPGSALKVWWNCQTGNLEHVHQAEVRAKVGIKNRKDGSKNKSVLLCPYCANRKIGKDNNMLVTSPDLAAEFHPTKNNVLVTEIGAGYGKKVWWQCIKGHEWESTPATRTYAKTQCPQCCEWNSSRNEDLFRDVIVEKDILKDIQESRTYKLNIPWGKRKTMFVDIVGTLKNSGRKLALEYDGAFYHYKDDVVDRDIRKTQALLDAGYVVVRVRENKLPFVNIKHENLFQINHKASLKVEKTEETINLIFEWLKTNDLL